MLKMYSSHLGINQELLDTCDIDVGSYFPVNLISKVVSSPRFEDTNVQKVHSN